MHWEDVCLPKDHGGLGIRPTKDVNLAMLSNLGWRLFNCKDHLWSQVVRTKYCRGLQEWPAELRRRSGSSYVWGGIVQAYNLVVTKGIGWNVCDGKSARFWIDVWLLDEALANQAQGVVTEVEGAAKVSEFWSLKTGWKWSIIGDKMLSSSLLRLAATTLVPNGIQGDVVR